METLWLSLPQTIPLRTKSRTLFDMAQQKILKRLKDFLDFASCVNDPNDGKALHKMRIAAKKLRYTLESFENVYGRKITHFYKAVYVLQTSLGQLHDAEMFVVALRKIPAGRRHKNDAALYHYLIGFFSDARTRAYKKFLRLWKENERKKTWVQLHDFMRGQA